MKSVVTPESWAKPDKHQMPLVNQPVAARFSRANAKTNYPDDGFWVINAPLVQISIRRAGTQSNWKDPRT